MRRRTAVLVCIVLLASPGLFAQERPQESCEQRLATLEETFAILQDQHALITLPRAEADQRMLIGLRRQLEQAQARIRELEKHQQPTPAKGQTE